MITKENVGEMREFLEARLARIQEAASGSQGRAYEGESERLRLQLIELEQKAEYGQALMEQSRATTAAMQAAEISAMQDQSQKTEEQELRAEEVLHVREYRDRIREASERQAAAFERIAAALERSR